MPTDAPALPATLHELLRRHWGYDTFRPLQAQAIAAVLERRDSLLVLPTGGGKSLCFQLPALALPGMAVVISPLVALIKDQVDGLRDNGIAAAALNSAMTAEERRQVRRAVREGQVKLLYLAPEALVLEGGESNESAMSLLAETPLSFFAIDEAHCISQWGHDYRPSFRALGRLRQAFPEASLHAFTATATTRVREDIALCLEMKAPEVMVGSFDRPNLVYRTHDRRDLMRQIEEVLGRHAGAAGIIYCIKRDEVDELARQLQSRGYKALPYHAGLSAETRRQHQDAFSHEDADLIVATVAFGMGIDRSNVRFVLHTGMPKAIENYQQEAGRAGRDGLPAECVLLYGAADAMIWRRMQPDPELPHGKAALRRIQEMYAFAQAFTCRHRFLVSYFDQTAPEGACGACDVCLGEKEALADSGEVVRTLLEGVKAVREHFGAAHVAQVLKGSRAERVLKWRHEQLPVHGALARYHQADLSDWLDQLVGQGLLERAEHGGLSLTEAGRIALTQPGEILLTRPRKQASFSLREREADAPHDPGLFEALRRWRQAEARAQGVPPYVIFGDQTLLALARLAPTEVAELAGIKGIGEFKRQRYGEALVALIREQQGEMPASTPAIVAAPSAGRKPKGASREETLACFRQGLDVAAIAERRGLAVSTLLGHLAEGIELGQLEASEVVPAAARAAIEEAVAFVGSEAPAAAIALLLPPEVEHGHVTCMLAGLRARGEASAAHGEKVRALVGLCRMPDPTAWGALLQAVADGDPRIRALAAYVLVRTSRDPAIGLLMDRLESETDGVALRGYLRALSAAGDPGILPALERRLPGFDAPTRQVAQRTWHRLAALPAP